MPTKPPCVSLIFCSDLTVPSLLRNSTHTAPRSPNEPPPSSSRRAPTARSPAPSPSRSPSKVTELPNRSPSSSTPPKPPCVSLIFWCDSTVPSLLRNSTHTAPPPPQTQEARTLREMRLRPAGIEGSVPGVWGEECLTARAARASAYHMHGK